MPENFLRRDGSPPQANGQGTMAMVGTKVAVIGLGALGLVTVKNLAEEGFDVVGFERNSYIGGLWRYTGESKTSVMEFTQVNISKERGCFTDFPFPEGSSPYPSAVEVQKYLEAYADHFQLEPRFRLNHTVVSVARDDDAQKWIVTTRDGQDKVTETAVDKLVVANGVNNIPNMPVLENQDMFKGRILHSLAYKVPEAFRNQRVLVVGLGSTAADTATSLAGVASRVYLSHSTGTFVLPRFKPDGTAFDHAFTYRKMAIHAFMENNLPSLASMMVYKVVTAAQNASYTMRPEWKLSPAPPLIHHIPIISDDLVSCLESGQVVSVSTPRAIIGASTVELNDGKKVDVDAIIFCTGYSTDYGFLGDHDPTKHPLATKRQLSGKARSGRLNMQRRLQVPVLYHNIFSLDFPESLAFIGTATLAAPAFQTFDLASMAIAQLWQTGQGPNKPKFPPRTEMVRSVESHLDTVQALLARGPLNPRWVQNPQWMAWVEEMAGVRLAAHLSISPFSFSLATWKLWWEDREFSRMLMDGILSPHLYRLFDSNGRRKKWDGARKAIEKVNADIKRVSSEGKKGK